MGKKTLTEAQIKNIKMRSTIELKPCPFCGKEIDEEKDVYMPERDWKPTFYDPDSGGDPISIHCKCGLEFSTGTYDYQEFINSWNKRNSK